jgi:hypothetical protein
MCRGFGNNLLCTDYVYFPWNTVNGQGRLKRITVGASSDPTSLARTHRNTIP